MSNKSRKGKLLKRHEIPKEYKWDIESMYLNEEAWEEDYLHVKELIGNITKYKGRLKESSQTLLEVLKLSDKINRITENLYVYSRMKKDEDNRVSKYQGLFDKAVSLSVEVNSSLSFIVPEILSIEDRRIKDFIKENRELQIYSFYLEEILRQREHVLSEKEEKILALIGEISITPKNIYTILNNADLEFPQIEDREGNKIKITKGNFIKLMESDDRELRKKVFNGLYSSYRALKNTLGTIYVSSVKKDNFYSKVRRYNSALEASLDNDNIPISVYNNLIDVIHDHLDLMYRYLEIRKKILKLDELHMYDLYTPLIKEGDKEIPYERAMDLVKRGLTPLGSDYLDIVKKAFDERWIDVYENEGKTSGAYSWGSYDSKPFILLNYQGTIKDVFTIAHEMGHSIHSYLSRKNQPYIYSSYKIFVAEVASTVNEAILMDYLLKKSKNKSEKLYLINHFLEQFRTTVYRQTMFAEFEKIIHLKEQEGIAITPDLLCEIYYSLNELYYGKGVVVDEEIKYEWSRVPHFYNPFYVYKYATGFSAAIALSQEILSGNKETVDKYLTFLKSGGSDYPLNLLKKAGVDMTTPKPIIAALKVFEELIEGVEKIL